MSKTKWDGAEEPTVNDFFKIDSILKGLHLLLIWSLVLIFYNMLHILASFI